MAVSSVQEYVGDLDWVRLPAHSSEMGYSGFAVERRYPSPALRHALVGFFQTGAV
jgi:hypothetical protein